MSEDIKPSDENALLECIRILRHLDPATRKRVINSLINFFGFIEAIR